MNSGNGFFSCFGWGALAVLGFARVECFSLVVVAQSELSLILEVEMGGEVRESIDNVLAEDFPAVFPFEGVLAADFRRPFGLCFTEVIWIHAKQAAENSPWRRRCACIEAVTDGGVDAGKGILLGFFENGEEPSQKIAGVDVGFV